MSRRVWILLLLLVLPTTLLSQNLEIHVINVGWGQAAFIKGPGPNGKTVLLEAGNTGKGTNEVVPYLQSIGHLPSAGFDYTVAGHQHCDHIGGMDEVIQAGYDVRVANYYNGSSYSSSCVTGWSSAAATTTAGAPAGVAPGTVIDIGGGATMTVVVVDGRIIGGGVVSVSDENDRSIGLLLEYGGFDYFWASDLGGGADDFACTGRSTSQLNIEGPVIQAISPGGVSPLISSGGIDVLHVSHHGSESSTSSELFNGSVPSVAIISTGAGQSSTWHLPRIDVVERVLLGQATDCVIAPPTFVLQTEEGSPTGSQTSFAGYCVGDIVITTDGGSLFTVSANGAVNQGPNEVAAAGLPRSFTIDDSAGSTDTQSPTTSITSPAESATVSGTTVVTASASDNVGVTSVEFHLDGILRATDTSTPYEWSWDTTTATNGTHTLVSRAFDAAGNSGTSAVVTFTVSNSLPPGANVGGWKLVQANATHEFVIPSNTVIPEEGYLVIARNAEKSAFESFWGGALPAGVVFLNSGDRMPVINGDENFSLYDATSTVVDGPTASMPSSAGRSLQRTDPCASASASSSWNIVAESLATPGSGAGAGCAGGVKINEFSDASGTGNFVYEFLELHFDSSAPSDTQPPSTSVTSPSNGATVSGTIVVSASASDNVGVTNVELYLDGALQASDSTAPYEWSWDTTTAADGSHSLTSKAYDAAGNAGTSAAVSVTVSNAPAGISLSAIGYKVKGKQKADLSWSGATSANVDIYRNSAKIMTTTNDGFETDHINLSGGGTYVYKVCEATTSTCSNEVTVVFN